MPKLRHNNKHNNNKQLTKDKTMITKREWEQITKTDSYHLLRLENESYIGYQLQRLYYFLKHLIIKH